MADDGELIRATVQGMVEGTMSPFARIIDNLFGPASTTLGQALDERARRFTHRSRQMLEGKRSEVGETNLRLATIIPIVQYGAIEENDELQDRWGALLANTSAAGNELPAAPDILRQLSPLDVCFLQLCYEYALGESDKANRMGDIFHVSDVEVTNILYKDWRAIARDRYGVREYASGKHPPQEWALTEDNCLRLGLVKERPTGRPAPDHNDASIMLTDLGFRFIRLCQIPTVTR